MRLKVVSDIRCKSEFINFLLECLFPHVDILIFLILHLYIIISIVVTNIIIIVYPGRY